MKRFGPTLLLTLLAVAATAQSLTLGVKAGSSTTSFRGDYTYSSSDLYDNPKTSSLVLTEYLNYKLTPSLSVQAELSYQKKGFEYKTGLVEDYAANGKAEFGYLQIPILFQFSYGSKLKVFANGGASINLLVSDGMYKYYYLPYIYYSTAKFAPVQPTEGIVNIKSDFNKVTLGIVGSAGVSYDITPTIGILGEFRIGYDLTKSSKNKTMTIPDINLPPNYNSYQAPFYFNNTHFLSYTVQGGVYFRLNK